ncbi:hypothetical protein ACHAWO_009138 [Cyclotella atomus]|uniref:Protein kinase domain-containing protein n=1 Tax=Cyclotella atomus TaxID=382360 RepID=A0ABD3PNN7_9STRA
MSNTTTAQRSNRHRLSIERTKRLSSNGISRRSVITKKVDDVDSSSSASSSSSDDDGLIQSYSTTSRGTYTYGRSNSGGQRNNSSCTAQDGKRIITKRIPMEEDGKRSQFKKASSSRTVAKRHSRGLDLSSRSAPGNTSGASREDPPDDGAVTADKSMHSYTATNNNTNENNYENMTSVEWGDGDTEQILGTFSVPTFKEEPRARRVLSRSSPREEEGSEGDSYQRRRSSRSNGQREEEGGDDEEDSYQRRRSRRDTKSRDETTEGRRGSRKIRERRTTAAADTTTSSGASPHYTTLESRKKVRSKSIGSQPDDDWMEDALLHGLSSANNTVSSGGSGTMMLSVPLGEPISASLRGEGSDDSEGVAPRVSIQERRRSSASIEHNEEVMMMMGTSPPSHSVSNASRWRQVCRRRSSKEDFTNDPTNTTATQRDMSKLFDSTSTSATQRDMSELFDVERSSYSKLHSTGRSSLRKTRGRKSTSAMLAKLRSSAISPHDDEIMPEEPRRNTLSNMADEDLAAYLMELSNNINTSNRKNTENLPSDALSNIPALPLVKTYKVIKLRPDEPAGLFLTKAKNGAVLVHSLSPESLFRRTNLVPGHELLSVNEKRVNDPKMAATLITQARGGLALRASGADRPRGFLYCQVKRKGEAGVGGAMAHGLRFVTTNIDGVKRGYPNSDGLVRVSAVDSNGLFAKSHPLNRLRVGSIVLTVNGEPTTNGRKALEMVMGSKQLVEVLHCDERVWREDWLWCSLEEAEGGERRQPEDVMSLVFRKEENAVTSDWSLEWNSERDSVVLRKKDADWAFKLLFNGGVGTCHCEEVEGKMLPPTDEFDVSVFVQLVNEKQRTIMQVLRNMLGRAKFELQFGAGTYKLKDRSPAAAAGYALLRGESTRVSRNALAEADKHSLRRGDSSGALATGIEEARSRAKARRKMSYDALHMMLMKDDEESVDDEMCNLVNDLLRVDDRDRKRQPQDDVTSGRRGSTGHIEAFSSANFDDKDFEAWYIANMGNDVSTDDKLQWIHSRRKRMDERRNNRNLDVSTRSGTSAYSMFSAGMMEDLEDYILDGLGSSSNSDPSFATNKGDLNSEASPESPRMDRRSEEKLMSPEKTESNSSEASSTQDEEKKADEQSAYITGVFRDVATKYEVSDVVVGCGGFGEVRECTDKKSGHTHVVKTINKPPLDDTSKINLIRNEILLLHEAKHPNIVELKDLFEDSKCVHIVMEKCTGGDLFDRVVNENPARIRNRAEAIKHESRTANTMRSIMQVIKYLHSKGIVHRDIKPEHFLLTTDKKESQRIKLIDFGLARKHKKGSPPMTTFTGSPSFVAPEVIARSYDHMCDLFSTGVTAYFLLTGMLPFDGPSDEDTFDLITIGEFRFPSSSIHLSDDARNFISKLLKTDPKKRMTAEEALNHPWLKKDASC